MVRSIGQNKVSDCQSCCARESNDLVKELYYEGKVKFSFYNYSWAAIGLYIPKYIRIVTLLRTNT